jgi:hypothetical protein
MFFWEGTMRKSWVLIVGLVMLVGCVTTRSVQLGEYQQRAAVPWKSVAVYRTPDSVPGKYNEIALLTAKGDSLLTGQSAMWKSLQKKAAKLGANAIILEATAEPKDAAKIASAVLLGFGPSRRGKAVAIYILPPEK